MRLLPIPLVGSVFAGSSYYLCSSLVLDSSDLDLGNPQIIFIAKSTKNDVIVTPKSIDASKQIITFYLKENNVFNWKTFTISSYKSPPPGYKINAYYTFKYGNVWVKLMIYRDQASNGVNKGETTKPQCFITWQPTGEDTTPLAQKQSIEDFLKQYLLGDAVLFVQGTDEEEKKPNYYCHKVYIDNLSWVKND